MNTELKPNNYLESTLFQLASSVDYLTRVQNQIICSFLMSFEVPLGLLKQIMEGENTTVYVFLPKGERDKIPFDTRANFPQRFQIFEANHLDQTMLIEIKIFREDATLDNYNFEYSLKERRMKRNIDRIHPPELLNWANQQDTDRILAMQLALGAAIVKEKEEFIKQYL